MLLTAMTVSRIAWNIWDLIVLNFKHLIVRIWIKVVEITSHKIQIVVKCGICRPNVSQFDYKLLTRTGLKDTQISIEKSFK